MIDSLEQRLGGKVGTKAQDIEIWLRCATIKNLKLEIRLELVRTLIQLSSVDESILQSLKLTSAQVKQYYRLTCYEITEVHSWLQHQLHHFISYDHGSYPERLRQCSNAPLYLFAQGNISLLGSNQLAVVGSRTCTYYGKFWAEELVSALVQHNLTITSGLALGIDTVAHRTTIATQGNTIAVLGSGFNQFYPTENRKLSEVILENNGLILSEFLLNTPPKAKNFPRRNRIISGLALGTLVVEASLRSGSLITARYALEQNRNIYAVPGSLGNPESEGCHWLIQQGGLLVKSADDILDDLQIAYPSVRSIPHKSVNIAETAKVPLPFAHLLANVGDEVTSVDVVAERAGQPVPETVAALLELELAGWIAAVPGGYVRLRRASHVRRSNVLI